MSATYYCRPSGSVFTMRCHLQAAYTLLAGILLQADHYPYASVFVIPTAIIATK